MNFKGIDYIQSKLDIFASRYPCYHNLPANAAVLGRFFE